MEVQVPDQPTGRLRRLSALVRRAGVALPALLVLAGLGAFAALWMGGGDDKPEGSPDTDPALTPEAAKKAAKKEEKRSGGNVVRLTGVGSQPRQEADPEDGEPSPAPVRRRGAPGPPRGASRPVQLQQPPRHGVPGHRAARQGAEGRHRAGAGERARRGQARDPRRQRDRQVPLQMGRRPRRLARQRLRLLGLAPLAGAGLLDRPLASGPFMRWGKAGRGKWITIYTNPGHIFMVVAGLRFDTSGRGRAGTRWQEPPRSTSGYVVRHPPGY